MDRREFLRIAAFAPAAVLAACRSETRPPARRASPTAPSVPPSPSPTKPAATLAWRRLKAGGPEARRDHSLTAHPERGQLYLFGGRTAGQARGDLWVLRDGRWKRLADGPPARFGHNAGFVDGRLLVFGGQAGGAFFSDLWAFDGGRWEELGAAGPSPRYGAGGTVIDDRLAVTHGFTNEGRFDDTWRFAEGWEEVSPASGPRPVERCLHRFVDLAGAGVAVLFGGQTTGEPFLGDTWLYNPEGRSWTELDVAGPSARNFYAAAATDDLLYLFGGRGADGGRNDLWSFDGRRWKELRPEGKPPGPRDGADAAVAGSSLFLFGGNDGSADLADLWELTLP